MKREHAYLSIWKRCLETFLGWPPAKVEEWATPFLKGLESSNSVEVAMAESGGALQWVLPLIVPEWKIRNLSGEQRVRALQEVEDVLEGGVAYSYMKDEFDWTEAKNRVQRFLEEHKEKSR